LSYKFYPKVFEDYLKFCREYGDVSVVPTLVFFYGLKLRQDITVEIAPGKTLLIRLSGIGPINENGFRTVFFKLNGQARAIEIQDRSVKIEKHENRKADKMDSKQIAVPLQGLLSKVLVKKGDAVKKNQALFVIEAMKMETTVAASHDTVISDIILNAGTMVNTNDLVLITG
jgi:pyruvate carboxylase